MWQWPRLPRVSLALNPGYAIQDVVCTTDVGSRKCDSAGISTSAPIMFHTNMNVSRMPMSAWNLIGE